MAARVKRSGVWEYFVLQVTDDSKVSCSLCNAVISRGGKDTKNFNTSNMRLSVSVSVSTICIVDYRYRIVSAFYSIGGTLLKSIVLQPWSQKIHTSG